MRIKKIFLSPSCSEKLGSLPPPCSLSKEPFLLQAQLTMEPVLPVLVKHTLLYLICFPLHSSDQIFKHLFVALFSPNFLEVLTSEYHRKCLPYSTFGLTVVNCTCFPRNLILESSNAIVLVLLALETSVAPEVFENQEKCIKTFSQLL
jgi:hypothetical protein